MPKFSENHPRLYLRDVGVPSWGYVRTMLTKRAAWLESRIESELAAGKNAGALSYFIGELASIERILTERLD